MCGWQNTPDRTRFVNATCAPERFVVGFRFGSSSVPRGRRKLIFENECLRSYDSMQSASSNRCVIYQQHSNASFPRETPAASCPPDVYIRRLRAIVDNIWYVPCRGFCLAYPLKKPTGSAPPAPRSAAVSSLALSLVDWRLREERGLWRRGQDRDRGRGTGSRGIKESGAGEHQQPQRLRDRTAERGRDGLPSRSTCSLFSWQPCADR